MRYILGLVLGAMILVVPGIPAFATWEDADEEPPLFGAYCDVDYWRSEVQCPSKKTALWAGLGALAGVVGAAIGRYPTRQAAPDKSNSVAESDPADPQTRDDVIQELALALSHELQMKHGLAGKQTIRRKGVMLYVSDDLRDRARQLNISVPFAVVDRALEMGWLSTQTLGSDEVLSRTSKQLPAVSSSRQGETVSDGSQPAEAGAGESNHDG